MTPAQGQVEVTVVMQVVKRRESRLKFEVSGACLIRMVSVMSFKAALLL